MKKSVLGLIAFSLMTTASMSFGAKRIQWNYIVLLHNGAKDVVAGVPPLKSAILHAQRITAYDLDKKFNIPLGDHTMIIFLKKAAFNTKVTCGIDGQVYKGKTIIKKYGPYTVRFDCFYEKTNGDDYIFISVTDSTDDEEVAYGVAA